MFSITTLIGNFAIAQKIPYMTQIDSKEMKYIDNTEVSISDWREYEFDMKTVLVVILRISFNNSRYCII